MTATRLYSVRAAARKLRTTRYRLAHLIAITGIQPTPVNESGYLAIDEAQFRALQIAHRVTPYRKAGRPSERTNDRNPAAGAPDVG